MSYDFLNFLKLTSIILVYKKLKVFDILALALFAICAEILIIEKELTGVSKTAGVMVLSLSKSYGFGLKA